MHRPQVVREAVRRPWRERLFSWPWRPLQRTEMRHVVHPSAYCGMGERWLIADGVIHCTPEGFKALMKGTHPDPAPGEVASPPIAAQSTGYPWCHSGNGWASQ